MAHIIEAPVTGSPAGEVAGIRRTGSGSNAELNSFDSIAESVGGTEYLS